MRVSRPILLWSLGGLLVLLIVGLVAARAACLTYLHSAAFRTMVGAATGHALGGRGEYQPFHFNSTTVYSDGFEARGEGPAAIQAVRAEQIQAELDWHGLLHKTCKLDEVTLARLDVTLAPPTVTEEKLEQQNSTGTTPMPKAESDGWKIDLRQAHVREARFRWGASTGAKGELNGAALVIKPSGESWHMDVAGGRLVQSGWPELLLESARLRYRGGTFFVTESSLRNGQGTVAVTGEISEAHGSDLHAVLTDIDVAPFLEPDWRAKLTGQLSAEVSFQTPSGAKPEVTVATGSARISGAQIAALPVLDQIALFTQSQRFRRLTLTTASCDFTRDKKSFTARNVVLESAGLLRMEGEFRVAGEQMDGTFQVGVTPASLQWLPGSRSRVFTVARDGYLWAPMRLSGPLQHPEEDLTARLAAAAGDEVIDAAKSTILDTANSLLDRLLR